METLLFMIVPPTVPILNQSPAKGVFTMKHSDTECTTVEPSVMGYISASESEVSGTDSCYNWLLGDIRQFQTVFMRKAETVKRAPVCRLSSFNIKQVYMR